jgi:hypothetical protein
MKLKIGNIEIDLAKHVPLTGRDWKELEKCGVKFGPQQAGNADNIMGLVLYVANKEVPNLNGIRFEIANIEDLPIARIVEAAAFIRSEGMEKDDPN